IHRDVKDRMVFLDCFSRFFRSFIGRIRGFRLPIQLKAKSAAISLLAPWCPDASSPPYVISLGCRFRKALCSFLIPPYLTGRYTQCALTLFPLGCARSKLAISQVAGVRDDRDVRSAAALPHCGAARNSASTKA